MVSTSIHTFRIPLCILRKYQWTPYFVLMFYIITAVSDNANLQVISAPDYSTRTHDKFSQDFSKALSLSVY